MLGAIVGDIVGSVYEWQNHRSKDFPLFHPDCTYTDDSVLTVATAGAILDEVDFGQSYRAHCLTYPDRGYGAGFLRWAVTPGAGAYNSFGNGSAMRVSPVAWAAATLDDALALARRSAIVTHSHPEGVKGAQATAAAIFLARSGSTKDDIRRQVVDRFGYDLSFSIDQIRPTYRFNETCQETVPQAIVAFLESTDFEDALRTAVSVGGDTDTLTCITGSIAEAHYGGVPAEIAAQALAELDNDLRATVRRFMSTHMTGKPAM